MNKQTKQVITREWVEKELRFYNGADIRSSLVLCGAVSLVFLPLTVMVVWGTAQLFESLWLNVIVSIPVGGGLSAPIWLNLLSLGRSLAERRWLARGEFEIVRRSVLYKDEIHGGNRVEKRLHFEGLRAKAVDNTVFQLASQGDDFYIVHYRGRRSVTLLYAAGMYEYRDR